MCGIAGYWEPPDRRSQPEAWERLAAMRDRLRHRGPDDRGGWLDPAGCVALGHRRLAILDLSPAGHQPMASRDGRYHLVYNGEAYNFRELRRELESRGHRFDSQSDTEVLLAGFCEWGPEQTLARVNGMFALAVWDGHQRQLLLARDRLGKKPLYYGQVGPAWVFASELKSLRALSDFPALLDRTALALYLRFGYVPTPHTIYQGVYKLPAGSWLRLPGPLQPEPLPPWQGVEHNLESALLGAVRRRMLADVPLGAFLSGGIDSSLLVALMQESSSRPVRTFSLGFRESGFDEAVYARQVAQSLGTDHTEHYVSAAEARSVIPLLPEIYDEPFADSSQIPTFLVSRLARSKVTVVLSGDGGDELFGGYNRYLWGPRVWAWLSRIPPTLRRLLAYGLGYLSLGPFSQRLGPRLDKLTKLAELMVINTPRQLYKSLVSPWREPDRLVISGRECPTRIDEDELRGGLAEWMMRLDSLTYLPDDILVKVDRASMAVGLEARAPFLDPEVVRLAWKLPLRKKIHRGVTKCVLREMLYKRLPQELFARPKAGFAIPLGDWLKTDLRGWVEDQLDGIPAQGYLHHGPVRERWREHLAGKRDWSASLWVVLMFQAWLEAVQRPG